MASEERATGYLCYRHRNVSDDVRLGRATCRPPYGAKRCPVRQPTFPAAAGGCLCCPMPDHRCPPCWGCLMPLSRRRAFGSLLYERETGGTANVYLAAAESAAGGRDLIFKLRADAGRDSGPLQRRKAAGAAGAR